MNSTQIKRFLSAVQLEMQCGYLASCRSSWKLSEMRSERNWLYFILDGSCNLQIEKQSFALTPGDFALLPAGKMISINLTEEKRLLKYWCEFTATVGGCSVLDWLPLEYVVRPEAMDRVQENFHDMLYDEMGTYTPSGERQNRLLQSVFGAFLERAVRSEKENRLLSVIDFMCLHMEEKMTLESLAEKAYVSPTAFSRSFRKTVGKAPMMFLNELRLGEAKRYLIETDMPIRQMAEICGFTDEFYFSRLFSSHTGMAPLTYRRERREKKHG